jgi:hypothetical protein
MYSSGCKIDNQSLLQSKKPNHVNQDGCCIRISYAVLYVSEKTRFWCNKNVAQDSGPSLSSTRPAVTKTLIPGMILSADGFHSWTWIMDKLKQYRSKKWWLLLKMVINTLFRHRKLSIGYIAKPQLMLFVKQIGLF